MVQQYLRIKAEYPDMLLFYRMGDFFELFFADAKRAAQLPDLTLTSRNKNSVDEIPINQNNLNPDLITKGIAKEAFEADNSRDRRESSHLLGKNKGMFEVFIEHRDLRTDEEFLQEIADQLGPEVARVAADELGLVWDG